MTNRVKATGKQEGGQGRVVRWSGASSCGEKARGGEVGAGGADTEPAGGNRADGVGRNQ